MSLQLPGSISQPREALLKWRKRGLLSVPVPVAAIVFMQSFRAALLQECLPSSLPRSVTHVMSLMTLDRFLKLLLHAPAKSARHRAVAGAEVDLTRR